MSKNKQTRQNGEDQAQIAEHKDDSICWDTEIVQRRMIEGETDDKARGTKEQLVRDDSDT